METISKSETGTAEEISSKEFIFENIAVDLDVVISCNVYVVTDDEKILFWSGQSNSIKVNPGKNEVKIILKRKGLFKEHEIDSQKSELKKDDMFHWRETKCSVCGTVFVSDKELHDWHKTEIVDGKEKYECTICDTIEERDFDVTTILDDLGSCKVIPEASLESYGITSSSYPPKVDGATYVTFGTWPQTVLPKDQENIIDTSKTYTFGQFEYYFGSDGEFYVKAKEDGYYYNSSDPRYYYSDGEQVYRQHDIGTKYRYFKVEPIVWRVVTDDYNGKKLLITERILFARAFYHGYLSSDSKVLDGKDIYPTNYEYSDVRAWLNGMKNPGVEKGIRDDTDNFNFENKGFLYSAFTSKQQQKILTTTVDNSQASTISPDFYTDEDCCCENTEDKIFLLSRKEITNKDYGFVTSTASDKLKRIGVTDYAKCIGASASGNTSKNPAASGYWRMRSPGNVYDASMYVDTSGIQKQSLYTKPNSSDIGIVPAICID